MNILVDEQGGFRKSRSCIDQAFVLSSIVKNRMNIKADTYAAFVDMVKCFDWIDRDLLLLKLISYNIAVIFILQLRNCIVIHLPV